MPMDLHEIPVSVRLGSSVLKGSNSFLSVFERNGFQCVCSLPLEFCFLHMAVNPWCVLCVSMRFAIRLSYVALNYCGR